MSIKSITTLYFLQLVIKSVPKAAPLSNYLSNY